LVNPCNRSETDLPKATRRSRGRRPREGSQKLAGGRAKRHPRLGAPPATIGTPRGVRESAARGIGVGCERRETPFVQRNIGERAVSAYLEYGAVRRFPMRCEAATARCSRAPARHDVPPIDLNGHFRPVSRFSTTRSRTPSGCRCVGGRVFRGYRCARPPANFCGPFRAFFGREPCAAQRDEIARTGTQRGSDGASPSRDVSCWPLRPRVCDWTPSGRVRLGRGHVGQI
jgi:hypothetical protein